MNNIKISTNFTLRELQSRDGIHQVAIHSRLLKKLQHFRDLDGRPVIITSGYRNASHNKVVGGSPTSRHLHGEAADIRIPGMHPVEVAQLAKVKKIDILNKVMGADWKQTITLTLGEIELTDANLIAIRKFRPDEEVMVNLSTLQLSLVDLELSQRQAMLDKDTDATPAPIPEPKPTKQAADELSLDLSAPLTKFDVLEGDAIEVKVFEEGEDDAVLTIINP